MRKHNFLRGLALILCLSLVLGLVPGGIFGANHAHAAETAEITATLNFTEKTQRTSFSTAQQVWKEGNLVFTNDKGSSSSSVGDYANPIRIYASSTVTIEHPGMTSIVITSDGTAKYKTGLENSLKNLSGATVTNSGNDYTITFDAPTDIVTFTAAAQIRFKTLTVTAVASTDPSNPDTPVCEHANTTTTTVDATCTVAGSMTVTCDDCGETVSTEDIAVIPHNYVDGVCTECGKKDASALAGNRYYIATIRTSGNYFYMTSDLGTASTKRYQAVDSGLTTLPTSISNPEAGYVFVLIGNDDGTFYLQAEGVEGDNYLGWTSGNSGALVAEANARKLTVDISENFVNIHFNASGSERYLSLNGTNGNNYFAWYTGTQRQDLVLIPISEGCQHTNTVDVAEDPATCTEGGYTAGIFCNDCESYLSGHEEIPATGHNYVGGACTNCSKVDPSTVEVPSATTTVVIANNGWSDGTRYMSLVVLEDYVSIAVAGSQYTGTCDDGIIWKVYQTDGGTLTITGTNGAVIKSVRFTYTVKNTGVLTYEGNNVASDDLIVVNASTATFAVGNTGDATNGQILITEIEVSYADEDAAPTCDHTNTTVQNAVDATCFEKGYSGDVICECGEKISSGEVTPALGHIYENDICTGCGFVKPAAVKPATGDSFYAVVHQFNIDKKLYFAGAMSDYYLATTENADEAALLYAEAVEGGFKLYFLNADVKTYINVYEYDTGKVGVQLSTEDGSVFVMDTTANTPVTTVIEKNWYIGCYNDRNTFSVSSTSYITDSNAAKVDISQFPMRLELVAKHECADTDGDGYCDVCENEMPAAHEHVPGEAVKENVVDATCTEAGSYDLVVYCTGCNEELSRETVEVPAAHTYTNGECVCGRKDIRGVNRMKALILDGVITVKATVAFMDNNKATNAIGLSKDYIEENGQILFWYTKDMPADADAAVFGTQSAASGLEFSERYEGVDEYYGISPGIAAKEYLDTIYYRTYIVVDGVEYYGDIIEYSVVTYCENWLKKTTATAVAMKPLLAAMLNYGAAAQLQLKYNTDTLANECLQTYVDQGLLDASHLTMNWDDSLLTPIVAASEEMTANFQMNSAKRTDRALRLEGAVEVKMVFAYNLVNGKGTKLPEGGSVTVYYWSGRDYDALAATGTALSKENATYVKTGEEITEEYTSSYGYEYVFYSDGIAAKLLGETVYMAAVFTMADGTEYCSGVEAYSPEYYAERAFAKPTTTEILANLLKWMVIYGETADAYFNK